MARLPYTQVHKDEVIVRPKLSFMSKMVSNFHLLPLPPSFLSKPCFQPREFYLHNVDIRMYLPREYKSLQKIQLTIYSLWGKMSERAYQQTKAVTVDKKIHRTMLHFSQKHSSCQGFKNALHQSHCSICGLFETHSCYREMQSSNMELIYQV